MLNTRWFGMNPTIQTPTERFDTCKNSLDYMYGTAVANLSKESRTCQTADSSTDNLRHMSNVGSTPEEDKKKGLKKQGEKRED